MNRFIDSTQLKGNNGVRVDEPSALVAAGLSFMDGCCLEAAWPVLCLTLCRDCLDPHSLGLRAG